MTFSRLSHVAEVSVSTVDKHTVEGEVPVRLCNYVDVYKNDVIVDELEFMSATATPDEIRRFSIAPGDTLFTKDSETADDIGVPAYVRTRAPLVCGYHVAIARPRARAVHPRYLFWSLASSAAAQQWRVLATGVTRVGLRHSDIGKFSIWLPDLQDQRVIADFLDRETAKIDALIAKQDALDLALREERTGRREMLIDGIWDGGEALQLRHVAAVTVGIVVTPSAWYAEIGVPALRGLNVKDERIDTRDLVYLTEEGHGAHTKSHLCEGDVVVVRTGQAGTAAAVPSRFGELNAIDLLIARPGPGLDGEYLAMVLNGERTQSAILSGTVGAIQGHFNVSALRQVEVPLPSFDRQQKLVRQWRATASRIDMMLSRGRALRDVLVERRAALITAAVTGKLDVTTYGKAG